ncbi:toxin glutamine deamidase domain-containing protein [Actinoplanes sp. TFC3]|uniref:toxin glutamine deamidase domain-containing protein n=1 Tax=Actinoplanes sp. TFC3 TaxID=1710355 RepID=UPI001EEF0BB3|nr:toxin glutamine deamidase domain-containing protein [Actinoplanes sp. TFC3]
MDPPDWSKLNDDLGELAYEGVEAPGRSALTGDDNPPSIDRSRPYGRSGGLRAPLAVHQRDLERAMPRESDGQVKRLADPRDGNWFALANDGGPVADPTRGINCTDGVLSLYETYIHGRPRVSAPRTFDAYAKGDPTRPLGAEKGGLSRIEKAVQGNFQTLTPYVASQPPAETKKATDAALSTLQTQLHTAGHGAFAFIVTRAEQGTSHAWSAVNQNGTILFLDPQTGAISPSQPLYTHNGSSDPGNVVALDALVVDNQGRPIAGDQHQDGLSAEPAGAAEVFDFLSDAEKTALRASVHEATAVAEIELERMQRVAHAAMTAGKYRPQLVGEQHRVKSLTSLARKFAARSFAKGIAVEDYLAQATDRVRFSMTLPESAYASTLRQVLQTLRAEGYGVLEVQSFFGDGRGRHNGLNVTLVTPEGFRMELQFPTQRSWQAGKLTHDLYEIIRSTDAHDHAITGIERTEAFLATLAINKNLRMSEHQPAGLPTLPGLTSTDTSLAAWATGGGRASWSLYLDALKSDGLTVEQALHDWNLTPDDIPGIERLDQPRDGSPVSLPSASEKPELKRSNKPDRLPGVSHDRPASGDLARGPAEMGLRPTRRGDSTVRRLIRDRVAASRSPHSRTPGEGTPPHQPPDPGTTHNNDRSSDPHYLNNTHQPPPAREPTSQSNAAEVERALLHSLSPNEQAVLHESVAEAQQVADAVARDLESVLGDGDGYRPQLAGLEHRVKAAASLGRTYATESELESLDVRDFLATVKDRVRFSMLLPEERYGSHVQGVLRALKERGYRAVRVVSFWGIGGRHNGLNVTLARRDGFKLELQFPTERSYAVGRATHQLYEAVRLQRSPVWVRVHAFLEIISIGRQADMDGHQPDDLALVPVDKHVDTSFAHWIAAQPAILAGYANYLTKTGQSFEDVLRRFGLSPREILTAGGTKGIDDQLAVLLQSRAQGGSAGGDEQHHRLPASQRRQPSRDHVERPASGMDLRAGINDEVPLRRPISGPDADPPAPGSRGDRQSETEHHPAPRGNAAGDVRGRGADGVGSRPTTSVGGGELVDTHRGPVRINARLGQIPGALGDAFQLGVHYPDVFAYNEERNQAASLGHLYDVRALTAEHDRTDRLGNPDVLLREDPADIGTYGELKGLNHLITGGRDGDLSRRVDRHIRDAFGQDPRITVVLVDGREAGLTLEGALRGIRRALGAWRHHGRQLRPEDRMFILLGDGRQVTWRGDSEAVDVSA